jgi:pimeloyl-ACP methyl ester carboxylesterase
MSFNIYSAGPPPSPTVPVVMCLHGGGYTGLTWAIVASRLKPHCRVIAPDLRGHGLTTTTTHTTYDTTNTNNKNRDSDLSLDTLASDVVAIWKSLFLASSTSRPPRTILLGHSMGGAVAVKAASLLLTIKPSIIPPPTPVSSSPMAGVMVIDVVEGTALASLPHMKAVLSNRPSSFDSLEEAVGWALGSGTSRNPEAARVSIPSMLVADVGVGVDEEEEEEEDSGEGEKGGEKGERRSMDGGDDGVGRKGSFHRRATPAVPMTIAGNALKDATLALQSVTEEEEEGEGGEEGEGDGGVEKQMSVVDKPMKRRATPMVSISYMPTDKAKNDDNSGILYGMNEMSIIAEDEEEEEEEEGEGGRETGEKEHQQQENQDQDSKDTEQHPPPAATLSQRRQQEEEETKRQAPPPPPPPPSASSMVLPSPFEFARSLVTASEKVKGAVARTVALSVEYGRCGFTTTATTAATTATTAATTTAAATATATATTAATATTTPGSVIPPPNSNMYYVWRTDLSSSQPYWEGWYSGLSDSFLNLPLPKVLILAGADSLDKTLTVGQMQGKFQLVLAPQSGHAVQEDEPDKVAETVVQFCQRFKLIEDKGGEGRGGVVLPQVAGPLHVN